MSGGKNLKKPKAATAKALAVKPRRKSSSKKTVAKSTRRKTTAPKAKRVVAKKKSQPRIVIPKPLLVNEVVATPKRSSSYVLSQRSSTLLSIVAILVATFCSMTLIHQQLAQAASDWVALQYPTSTHKPARWANQTLPLSDGQLTVAVPEQLALTQVNETTLSWDTTNTALVTMTLTAYPTTETSLFTWLEHNPPAFTFTTAQVPLTAVSKRNGIMLQGMNDTQQALTTIYFLQDNHVFEISIEPSDNDIITARTLNTFIEQFNWVATANTQT